MNTKEIERIFHSAPFIRQLGLQMDAISEGECRSSLKLTEHHLQQDGFVHAGVQASVADHTAGAAAASLVPEGQSVLSAEFKINLLRAAKGNELRCIAKVLKAGNTLTIVESEVYCGIADNLRLVSKATVTLAVVSIRHEQAL